MWVWGVQRGYVYGGKRGDMSVGVSSNFAPAKRKYESADGGGPTVVLKRGQLTGRTHFC